MTGNSTKVYILTLNVIYPPELFFKNILSYFWAGLEIEIILAWRGSGKSSPENYLYRWKLQITT